jgi:hypothetical protein
MLNREQYYVLLTLMWVYALVWSAAAVAGALYWDRLGGVERCGIVAVLALVAPDIETLICSYGRYVRQWAQLYSHDPPRS